MASIMMSSGLAAVAPQVRPLSVRRLAAKQTDAVPVFPENDVAGAQINVELVCRVATPAKNRACGAVVRVPPECGRARLTRR
jgi:hypothetical protein